MAQLARRLLAMASIAGGGLLGAAPAAFATAPDPTPTTVPPSQAASTPGTTPPSPPLPPVTLPLRTGLAVPSSPDAPAADDPPDLRAAATLRTGRAADLNPPPTPAPAPSASAATPQPPPIPAPPAPTPRRHDTSTPSAPVGGDQRAPTPVATPPAAAPPPPATTYTVVSGDSLWSIAAAQVAPRTGQTAASVSAAEVTPYWQALCDANRSSLRSGDINLIFAGEQILLPPPSS
jgi:hypothetical protein